MNYKGLKILLIILAILVVIIVIVEREPIKQFFSKETSSPTKSHYSYDYRGSDNNAPTITITVPTEESTKKPQKETTVAPTKDPITGLKTSFTDLRIGDIGKKDGVYVGLQYVKTMSYLPTRLGSEEVSSENEVLLGFFEFYNSNGEPVQVDPDSITCYVDGVQVYEVQTYIKVEVDGIRQYTSELLDDGFQLLSVQDFEVKKGWKEAKFYYQSDCVWTITPKGTHEDAYQKKSLFYLKQNYSITKDDEILYDEDYRVQYKGFSVFHDDSLWQRGYAVFKYRITNNGSDVMSTSLMGYDMRAYHDSFFLDEASYTLSEKIDGCANLFDVDSIEAGMSADIYLAFEIPETENEEGNYCMIYDDGYIANHYCGAAFAKWEK